MEANQGRAVRGVEYWVPRFRGNDRGSAEMTEKNGGIHRLQLNCRTK